MLVSCDVLACASVVNRVLFDFPLETVRLHAYKIILCNSFSDLRVRIRVRSGNEMLTYCR